MQIQDALSYFDNGLSTLNGAHFGLYYGSIRELGSEAVQNKWLPLADTFEVPGCFALTGSLLFFFNFFYYENDPIVERGFNMESGCVEDSGS